VLLWLATDPRAIRRAALERIGIEDRVASIVSLAEIAIKASLGKLPLPPPFSTDFGGALRTLLQETRTELLPISVAAVEHLRQLPFHHRDPFDRIIIAEAFANGFTVATTDRAFAAYDGLLLLDA
jgi:PIN domain nuclease of toxin-antitoxin system